MINTYKSYGTILGTTAATSIYSVSGTTTGIVNSVTLSNASNASTNATLSVVKAGITYSLITNGYIPTSTTLQVLDAPIILETGNSLYAMSKGATGAIHVFVSVLEIVAEQRSQIYAVSWYSIAGNVADWSESGSNEVTQFSHVKPAVFIKNTYNEVPNETEVGSAWQPAVIRNQLTMLDVHNNLPNTNIKNIIPVRYQGGWLYGTDPDATLANGQSGNTYNNSDSVNGSNTIRSNSGHLIWPDNEIVDMRTDWESFLTLIDGDKQNENGMRIANTRILFDNESILTSSNFVMNEPYFDALLLDPRSSEDKFDVPSLKTQIGNFTWDNINCNATNTCGHNGNSDYQIWNKSVEKITTAAISKALLTPFKERYGVDARASNWESNITTLGDGYPEAYGHESYHDNIFGDSANIVLYGWESQASSGVWCINTSDDTRVKRIQNAETPFTWHNNAWNAFMVNVQCVRSVKRGLISRGLYKTSINAWIAAKERISWGDLKVGFANTEYYDEMVRHASLTGIEFFAFFNDEYWHPEDAGHIAKRIEQFGVINAILVDINDKLDGYTPRTLDDSRVSYNCDYVMSGAPTATGTYLWRVTPKFLTDEIFSDGVLVPKIGSQIGVWIITESPTNPTITIPRLAYDAAMTALPSDCAEIIARFNVQAPQQERSQESETEEKFRQEQLSNFIINNFNI